MKLSLIVPSPHAGPRIQLNLLHVCSLADGDSEVIVLDYSGDRLKRDFLEQFRAPHCHILSLDHGSTQEALQLLLEQSTGDFVWFCRDQDYVNGHSLPALCREIARIGNVPSIVGTTGVIVVEDAAGSAPSVFDGFSEVPGAEERVHNFLNPGLLPLLHHSPLRRSVLDRVVRFLQTLPVHLPCHDWLLDSLVLMHGRLTCIPRYVYQSMEPNAATPELRLKRDADSFAEAGLDPSAVHLQWLMLAFEGWQAIATKYDLTSFGAGERSGLGEYWFAHWFTKFQQSPPLMIDNAAFDLEARLLADKWRTRSSLDASELLADIAEYYSLSSPETGQRYYRFWSGQEKV